MSCIFLPVPILNFLILESSVALLLYPSALPTFSTTVQEALSDGTVYQIWDQFVREATDFYFPEMPQEDGKARLAYQHIGRTLYERYPCIMGEGQSPWVSIVIVLIDLFIHKKSS